METGPNERLFMQEHTHLSQLMDYPPFTTSSKKFHEFEDALTAAVDVMAKKLSELQDDMGSERDGAFKDVYLAVVTKFISDIEEAELYQVRYGADIRSAQVAALEAGGKTLDDDDDVPGLWHPSKVLLLVDESRFSNTLGFGAANAHEETLKCLAT